MRLDYYITTLHPFPQLWDGSKIATKTVFLRVKKQAPHLLRYFTIHHNDKGAQEIRVTLPPNFEGHILQQFNHLFQHAKEA